MTICSNRTSRRKLKGRLPPSGKEKYLESGQRMTVCCRSDQSRSLRLTLPLADVFDFLLTRNLESGHIVDFQPYASKTDALLFTYEELENIRHTDNQSLPELRVVDDSTDFSRIAPKDIHNKVPMEFLSLSAGQNIEDFKKIWEEEIQKACADSDSEQDD